MNYKDTCYICVTGGEDEHGPCRDSIHAIRQRPGDEGPVFGRGTKGYEVRQKHFDHFMQTDHDWLLMLDADMVFPANTLERLRSHGLPFVSGFYMRRSVQPIAPVWTKPFVSWPFEPWLEPVQPDTVYPIGSSGWGCILLHRDVVTATREILKGEPDVIEDDCDVWPYSLPAVMASMSGIEGALAANDNAAALQYLGNLKREFRPLRVDKKTTIGSDIRYPFYALQAGYQLHGDSGVACGHNLAYYISLQDWQATPGEYLDKLRNDTGRHIAEERGNLEQLRAVLA